MTAENDDDDAAARRADETEAWQEALSVWREYPAEMFDPELKQQVRDCVARIGSTADDWRAAIGGDSAAAVKVALRLRMPHEVDVRLDLAMTVLLSAAFEDAAAASVMAHLVNRAPLDPVDKTGIATSWLVHKILCESRIHNRRRRQQWRIGDAT
jgi:hypothetical protein